jgi:hypothetical protein
LGERDPLVVVAPVLVLAVPEFEHPLAKVGNPEVVRNGGVFMAWSSSRTAAVEAQLIRGDVDLKGRYALRTERP